MHQSPKPSSGANNSAGYSGAGTPQRVSQDSSTPARPVAPPDLTLTLTGSSVRTNDIVVENPGEAAQASLTPARVVGGVPGGPARAVAPSPMRPQTTTPATSHRSYNMTPQKTKVEPPITPAIPADTLPVMPMPRVRTPPIATSTPGVPSADTMSPELSSRSHDSLGPPVNLGLQAQKAVPTPSIPPQNLPQQTEIERQNPFEDDENTEPSSMTGSHDQGSLEYYSNRERAHSIGRIIRSTRKRLSSKDRGQAGRRRVQGVSDSYDSDEEYASTSRSMIYGYLHKLGRNGKWQRRFFETDGECLSYYKSSNRTKLLATLDLCKVGEIVMDSTDPTGCTFTIQVSDRPYSLRAESSSTCKDWVITLNRIKEARMHLGNTELMSPKYEAPPDLLDRQRTESEDYAAFIVVNANRPRTRAVDDNIKSWDQLVEKGEKPPDFLSNSPVTLTQPGVSPERPPKRIVAHLPPEVMARWQKRQSLVYTMGRRIVRWAKRMRKLRCMAAEDDVQLDHRVHPPGHNDPEPVLYSQNSAASKSKDSSDKSKVSVDSGGSVGSASGSPSHRTVDTMSHTEWIGKEAQILAQSIGQKEGNEDEDSDKETRELS